MTNLALTILFIFLSFFVCWLCTSRASTTAQTWEIWHALTKKVECSVTYEPFLCEACLFYAASVFPVQLWSLEANQSKYSVIECDLTELPQSCPKRQTEWKEEEMDYQSRLVVWHLAFICRGRSASVGTRQMCRGVVAQPSARAICHAHHPKINNKSPLTTNQTLAVHASGRRHRLMCTQVGFQSLSTGYTYAHMDTHAKHT